MNKKKLRDLIIEYLDYIKNNYDEELEDLNERQERESYYQSFNKEKIENMTIEEFQEYISKLWAMIIWGNKKYKIDQLIEDNGFSSLKEKISELLYGKDNLEDRWDKFKKQVKGFGPAMMSELLCYAFPNECMLWNRTAISAYQNLEISNIPIHNYQLTGKKYMELTQIAIEIKEEIASIYKKDVDLLFVDYFFWNQLRDSVPIAQLEKDENKESVVNNKSYHNEIVDYIKNIGSLLGYNTNLKGNIKESGKIADAIWEFNVGNLGKIKYVFEVQDNGSIDSLIVSLMNASQDISVQAVVAVSDENQITKIKQHCNSIEGSFNGKLKFWNIREVERAYSELSNSMEIINKAINVNNEK